MCGERRRENAMDEPEDELQTQRERLEAAEVFAFIFPLLDRLLVIDVRALPLQPPETLVVASADIVTEFLPRFQRQLTELFQRRPELVFSRLRLFAYLDGALAQLVVDAALARAGRPLLDREREQSFAYARVRAATAEFFGSALWELVEEKVIRDSGGMLRASLDAAREALVTWERELLRRAAEEERRRLFSERYYRIIRPQDPNPS